MPTFYLSLQLYLVGSKPPEEDVCVNQNDVLIRSERREGSSREKVILQSRALLFSNSAEYVGSWRLPRDLS